LKVVAQISNWVSQTDLAVITGHSNQAICAYQHQIASTPVKQTVDVSILAADASVWLMQQPEKPFAALTTAIYCYAQE
jgi:hypothetical protein